MPATQSFLTKQTLQIVITSLIAVLFSHLMLNTLFGSIAVNIAGMLLTSYFIYYQTLRKNDIFSFVMVIYFTGLFPVMQLKGGGFNYVVVVSVFIYIINNKRFPVELRKDKWLKILAGLWLLSSVLGWIFNFTGSVQELMYSIISFSGVILILLISGSLHISKARIIVFIQLNAFILMYSLIINLNDFLNIINANTLFLPIYDLESKSSVLQGGGIIKNSVLFGEQSFVLLMLFFAFYIFGRKIINKKFALIWFILLAYIGIFMSVTRSAFMLSFIGVIVILLFQFKIGTVRIKNLLQQISLIVLLGGVIYYSVSATGLDYVFEKMESQTENNRRDGGLSVESIMDGSAFNREVAFKEGADRFKSKDSWIIGYGWGLKENMRDAFFVDTSFKYGSSHSQMLSILFLFGWLGTIAYWGLLVRIIIKSYSITGKRNVDILNRIFALFFMISLSLFILNEIKVDCIYLQTYFTITVIWIGLAYSNLQTTRKANLLKVN